METVAAWQARTGRPYRPATHARRLGSALREDDSCPVLFRYPGPCGLRELFSGALGHLAPADSPWLWMSERAVHDDVPGARFFGSLALREPLAVGPVRAERNGMWVAANLRARDAGALAWVPPSRVGDKDVPKRLARGERLSTREELLDVQHALAAYLEELAAVRHAAPPRSWCSLPPRKRRALLDAAGVAPTWTGRFD